MSKCLVCASTLVQWHHVIGGHAYRHLSEKYRLLVPLCKKHHDEAHQEQELADTLKAKAQICFEKRYSHQEWMDNFKIDYKERYERIYRK